MNVPFQPRARAGMTPTGSGRFPVPSGVASGSKARRGFTPRSSSRAKPGSGVSSEAKPKLSTRQQLELVQRLESGNFQPKEGLKQFYEEAEFNSNANKLSCKQNLFSSFAAVDPIASSTRNYGNGLAGSMESLISVGSSIIASNPSTVDADVTSLEAPIMPLGHILESDDDEYDALPDYIKVFDRLLLTRANYCKILDELAEARCALNFAKFLPQEKMVSVFKSLERVQKILQKFLDGNASENMNMFMPVSRTKGSSPVVIHSDVENHTEIIETFYKLNDILEEVDYFAERDSADFKLEARMESFKDFVGNLETAIKTYEQYSTELRDVVRKTGAIELDDECFLQNGVEVYDDNSPL